MAIIKAHHLNKIYTNKTASFQALKDFSLVIEKPEIYGLVGPNGAGKTTFIKHCLGLVQKTDGVLEVLACNPFNLKQRFLQQIGFISGHHESFESRLSGQELLRLQAALYNLSYAETATRIKDLVHLFDLNTKLETPLENLSLGQKMKFEIISKVLHKPKLLFLDEPTLGLDFEAQNMMHELLLRLHHEEGVCILLTSHYLPDISRLCNRFSVIENGQNMFTGTFSEIKKLTNHEGYLKTLIEEINK